MTQSAAGHGNTTQSVVFASTNLSGNQPNINTTGGKQSVTDSALILNVFF